jgi:CTP:molybdopterin cytidylyltransferase MocA
MPPPACLLLLAAGAARRMRGGDKLCETVDGVPVLRLLCLRGLAAGLSVRVTLPDAAHPRAALLDGLAVRRVVVPDHAEGMAASLRRAVAGLDAPAALVLPGDMPEITTDDLRAVAQAPGAIVQACAADGTPGHPVRFAARFFPELAALAGDVGARAVLRAHRAEVVRLPLPARHAVTDLDTPEAWAAWRAARGGA